MNPYIKQNFQLIYQGIASHLKKISAIRFCYAFLFDNARYCQFKTTHWVNEGIIIQQREFKSIVFEDSKAWVILPNGLEICYVNDIPGAGIETSIYQGRYEQYLTETILSIAKENSTFIDIGANIGWFSLHVAKNIPSATVHAFEPGFFINQYLRKNVIHNRLNKQIQINNYAVSNNIGTAQFTKNKVGHALNHLKSGLDLAPTTEVKTTTIDHYVKSNNIQRADIIKCDVEGAELLVLHGARETILAHHPTIILEINPDWTQRYSYNPNEIWDFLANIGYDYITVDTHKSNKSSGDFEYDIGNGTNVIFTHNNSPT
jgi:FkbM family methyltransferase